MCKRPSGDRENARKALQYDGAVMLPQAQYNDLSTCHHLAKNPPGD